MKNQFITILNQKTNFLKKYKLENYFIVLYSGNQGRCHDLNTLLNAAKILKIKKIYYFYLLGMAFKINL